MSSNTNIEKLDEVFSKGLETWNPQTQTIGNQGGVKLWWTQGWKRQETIFITEQLFKVIRGMPVSLYVMSSLQLDNKGKPMQLETGRGLARQSIGIMLYTEMHYNDVAAKGIAARVIEQCPELEGFVFVASDIEKEAPHIKEVENMDFRDSNGNNTALRTEGCVFLTLQSGSEGGSQYWGYRSKNQTRAQMSRSFTNEEEIDPSGIGI